MSKNLNTLAETCVLNIVFSELMAISISPVLTDTNLIPTVTVSLRYSTDDPIPNNLAPSPPVVRFASYPTIPPSINTPANNNGVI